MIRLLLLLTGLLIGLTGCAGPDAMLRQNQGDVEIK